MNASHEDPIVSLDDIAYIRRQLFRRWTSTIVTLGLKLLALWFLGLIVLYTVYAYTRSEWTPPTRIKVVALVMSAMALAPFLIHVGSGLWLDFRIARRLDSMAKRTRDGESVRASEVSFDWSSNKSLERGRGG